MRTATNSTTNGEYYLRQKNKNEKLIARQTLKFPYVNDIVSWGMVSNT
jgi:hypothetical protein